MKAKGFTLIELMVVVGIAAILTLTAMTSYQDFIAKERVVEGLHMASSAQLAVIDTVNHSGALPSNQAETHYQSPNPSTNVQSISIAAAGIITITYSPIVGGGTIRLVPTLQQNGDVFWDCKSGTLQTKYRPANCR